MGRSCRSGSGWIFGLLLLLISTSVGQNTTRAKEYQPEGCLRCGQPCLQAAENTLLPCITAAVGEAMTSVFSCVKESLQTATACKKCLASLACLCHRFLLLLRVQL